MRSKRVVAAALGLALGLMGAARADYSPAQLALFDTAHLANLNEPLSVDYAFRKSGSLEDGFTDKVLMTVTEVLPDGRKNLSFQFFTGERKLDFEPIRAFKGNPVIMLFLQRDVMEMNRLTGGSQPYFRNRIRHAFRDGADVGLVSFSHQGETVDGTRVTLEPFKNDPKLARFPRFKPKRYEFTLAPTVPGGIYRIRTVIPGSSGDAPLIEESMTYNGFTGKP